MTLAFQQSDFALNFLSLFLEGAPYILLGTMISGFIDVFMPSSVFERFLPKNKFLAIFSCGMMGFILPVCECAVVPVIRRLVAKGLPVSCAFTYMLAAPILNPITVWSTWHAFNGQDQLWNVLSRCGLGYLVAITVGIIIMILPIERVIRKSIIKTIRSHSDEKEKHAATSCSHHHEHEHHHHDHDHSHDHSHVTCCHEHHSHGHQPKNSLVSAMRSGLRDSVDVGVYFTIGVCLAAMFNILYVQHQEVFNNYLSNPFSEIGGMMLLAFLLSVCSTSDAFMAATYNFVGAGAKMSFMVLGPMLDVKLLFLYQSVMKKKFLATFSVGLFLLVGLLCWTWETTEIGKDKATAIEKSWKEDAKP